VTAGNYVGTDRSWRGIRWCRRSCTPAWSPLRSSASGRRGC